MKRRKQQCQCQNANTTFVDLAHFSAMENLPNSTFTLFENSDFY